MKQKATFFPSNWAASELRLIARAVLRAGSYNVVFAAVVVSTTAAIWGFQHALSENTRQLAAAFRADNSRALAAGDLPVITSRLNALMSSVNWVCIDAAQDHQTFFQQRRGDCAPSFLQRRFALSPPAMSDVSVVVTLRLPQALEHSFTLELLLHVLCLGLILWGTRNAELVRHVKEARRVDERRREELRRADMLAALAGQVAHDIRSPLAVLEAASAEMSGIPEDQRIMIRRAASHMRDIANSLLSRYVPVGANEAAGDGATAGTGATLKRPAIISSLVEMLVSEKRLQFRERANVTIETSLDGHSYGLFAMVDPTEFKRVLSNLINNAVEALPAIGGRVDVDLAARDDQALISVRDNGKGIAPDVLGRLGARGQSHGKPGGSGLGLAHARACIADWGGRFELESRLGEGATATVALPLVAAPSWYVPEIAVGTDRVVVVLDDDTNIHQIWRRRVPPKNSQGQEIELVHAFNPADLREWVAANPAKASRAQFLLDHQLVGYTETGLDLAAELSLADRAVLVTSAHDDPAIIARCEDLRVGLIPKSLARIIPLRVRETAADAPELFDAVLIDDDELVQKLWVGAAESNQKKLRVFSRTSEFLSNVDIIDRRSPIFLDSRLGNGGRGEVFARDLHARGFKTLFLATGQSPRAFGKMPWITKIVGKTAPWSMPAPIPITTAADI